MSENDTCERGKERRLHCDTCNWETGLTTDFVVGQSCPLPTCHEGTVLHWDEWVERGAEYAH